MSVPAGLMQALQGASGSASAPTGPASAMPPSITIPPSDGNSDSGDSGKSDGDWEEDLQAALAALRALAADATDHVETNTVDKCIAALSALTAKRQQGHESALGVTPASKAMSRAYGG